MPECLITRYSALKSEQMQQKGLKIHLISLLERIALNRFFPYIIFTSGIILSIFLWQHLSSSQLAPLKSELKTKSTSIKNDVKKSLESKILALKRMAIRWGARKDMPFKEWQVDAKAYISHYPGLKAVEWADNTYHIRWIEPLKGNERAMNLNILFNREREASLKGAGKKGTITLTPPLRLVQGYKAFIAYVPVYVDEEFKGFIIGVFDISLTLNHYLGDLFSKNYYVKLYINNIPAFQNYISEAEVKKEFTTKETMQIFDKTWSLEITPTQKFINGQISLYPYWFLIGGILISALLALLISSLRTSRENVELLKESELRFQLAVGAAQDGIWDWEDVEKPEVYWSPQCSKLLGYDTQDVNQSYNAFWPLLHPDDLVHTKQMFHDHFSKNKPFDINYRLQNKSGEYNWFHVQAVSVRDESGKVLRMVGSMKDINDRMLFETEQKRLIEMLTRSNAELDDFAYIASHDLKEPLRAIRNHSTFLLEDYEDKLDEDGVKKLNRLIFLSQRMETLISDLLYFSRLGQEKPKFQMTDMNTMMDDLQDTMSEVLEEKNAHIVLPDPLPSIMCDSTRTTELFRNLITNAIKYNDSEKKIIEIGCTPGNEYTFYVRDNGIGIAPDMFDSVFRIFKRLNKESAYGEGTGVGLSFVKKIIERNGGKIWLESEPGQGTTFFFTFGTPAQNALSA